MGTEPLGGLSDGSVVRHRFGGAEHLLGGQLSFEGAKEQPGGEQCFGGRNTGFGLGVPLAEGLSTDSMG